MIRHGVAFYDLYPFDSRPLLDPIHHYLSLGSVQFFESILGYPDDVVLTLCTAKNYAKSIG
jgi:hypothetical protein